MPNALLVAFERFRVGRFCAPLVALSLAACIGGPHPLPPGGGKDSSESGGSPILPPLGVNPTGPTPVGAAGTGAATPPSSTPTPTSPAPMAPTPPVMTPPAANGGAAGSGSMSPQGAAGSAPVTPPPQGTGGSAASPDPNDGGVCDGATGALSAAPEAPRNVLFVMDRSLEMAGEFEGSPRWQVAAQALSHALGSHASNLQMGALLYPSASTCSAPGWLCSLQPQSMCEVSSMSARDQVAFRPASEAVAVLLDDAGLYAPVMVAGGVPLGESLARADAALAASSLTGKTSVVILASGMPSCAWDSASASATVSRWRERGVQTHVVALPGSPSTTPEALAALAEAGGSSRVHTPGTVGALEATLQSVVFESLSSCTLRLDPPAPEPSAVQVVVTVDGTERTLPRTSASGETLWTISADGSTVTLAGSACEAAKGGTYEAVRIVLGCSR